MPPKLSRNTKPNQLTIIKFKRNKSTYVLALDLHLKSSLTLKKLKEQLTETINLSGGLPLIEEEVPALDDDDEDNIPVPKSELIDEDINEEKSNDQNIIKQVSIDDIKLAIPKDKTSPYDNQWIEITDDLSLSSITFNDNDIIAFSYIDDDSFNIVEAAYEE